jgi:hypothetical protein
LHSLRLFEVSWNLGFSPFLTFYYMMPSFTY